jgi:acyl dehydratase
VPLNPEAVGASAEPVAVSWTSKDALLYAVGIGAGTDELAFTTENTAGVDQQLFPTFPVVIDYDAWSDWDRLGIGTFDPAKQLHGRQGVTLHKPLAPEGSAQLTVRITGMYDKGEAAVVTSEAEAVDPADGSPLYTLTSSACFRGEGGWGGERGPSGPRNLPPERTPDHTVSYEVPPDQALIYRLCGDRNPLHSDPSFARDGGFDRPILHGLCTYGYTGRALLHSLCESDPARFESIEARFSAPAFPGETLDVSIWEVGDGEAVFSTTSGSGTAVIDQGRCTWHS